MESPVGRYDSPIKPELNRHADDAGQTIMLPANIEEKTGIVMFEGAP
jgi:hypothetical protein